MTKVIAHRGASAYAPENTIAAFELAIQQGADMVELDVQRSADGTLIIFHDETTERWDGQRKLAIECSLDELRQLDIGGERIATLQETCEFAKSHSLALNVELKGFGIGADVCRILRETGVEELVLFSSFVPEALREVQAISPHIPRAYLMGTDTLRPKVRLRESWPLTALRQEEVQVWHPAYQIPFLSRVIPVVKRAGYGINVWTVNDPRRMRQLIELGVDGIITDTPDVLRRIVDELLGPTRAHA